MRKKSHKHRKSKFAGWTERAEIHGTLLYVHEHHHQDGSVTKDVALEGSMPTDGIMRLIQLWCEVLSNQITLNDYIDLVLARDLNGPACPSKQPDEQQTDS